MAGPSASSAMEIALRLDASPAQVLSGAHPLNGMQLDAAEPHRLAERQFHLGLCSSDNLVARKHHLVQARRRQLDRGQAYQSEQVLHSRMCNCNHPAALLERQGAEQQAENRADGCYHDVADLAVAALAAPDVADLAVARGY